MTARYFRQKRWTALLLSALAAASGTASADPGVAPAAAAVRPIAGVPAAVVDRAVLQPPTHLGIDEVAGTEREARCPMCPECPRGAGLDGFSSKIDGTYEADGKTDSAIRIDFPQAPQAGSTLDSWLNALNDQLLAALDLKLSSDERARYGLLEQQKCSTIYCQIAMRQQTTYYLLGGK